MNKLFPNNPFRNTKRTGDDKPSLIQRVILNLRRISCRGSILYIPRQSFTGATLALPACSQHHYPIDIAEAVALLCPCTQERCQLCPGLKNFRQHLARQKLRVESLKHLAFVGAEAQGVDGDIKTALVNNFDAQAQRTVTDCGDFGHNLQPDSIKQKISHSCVNTNSCTNRGTNQGGDLDCFIRHDGNIATKGGAA